MAAKVNIAKHPVHPMLVAFPIGLWFFSLAADIIVRAGGPPVWNTVSWYSMGGGIIGAIGAAVPGLADLAYMKDGAAKRLGLAHALLNVGALIVYVVDFFLRGSIGTTTGLFILSIVGIVMITVSGWIGGSMVYLHGAAVEAIDPEAQAEEPPEEWKKAA